MGRSLSNGSTFGHPNLLLLLYCIIDAIQVLSMFFSFGAAH
jgi:hypothetical protein